MQCDVTFWNAYYGAQVGWGEEGLNTNTLDIKYKKYTREEDICWGEKGHLGLLLKEDPLDLQQMKQGGTLWGKIKKEREGVMMMRPEA